VPEDDREQPQDAHDAGLVGELDPELSEVDLRLLAGGGLEAPLEGLDPRRPGLAQEVRDDAVAALVPALLHLAQQPLARQVRPGRDADAQVVLVRRDQPRLRRTRAVRRRRDADLEVLAHRLAVHAELARDGRDAEPLPLQIVDQDDLSQCDHLPAPRVSDLQVGRFGRRRSAGGMPPAGRRSGAQTGDFSNGTSGEFTLGTHTVFVAVDHCSAECVGIHAALCGTRHEALEPIRQGVTERFGGVDAHSGASDRGFRRHPIANSRVSDHPTCRR
jgi:hypothetical protein